jgi:phosphoglycolate phosphatase-like HAD superfamily hydrolase
MAYKSLNKEKQIYLRSDVEETVRRIDKLIFDFDGVLVQTSESYRQTIRRVVDYYFLEILGLEGEESELATLRDIQKFKDTGLYNNDWNLSYAFITYYLNLIRKKLQQKNILQDFVERFCNLQFSDAESFIQELRDAGDFLRRNGLNVTDLSNLKNDVILGLDLFLAQANLEKSKSIETSLLGVDPEVESVEKGLVRRLMPYDLEKPDLLKRLFEEIYLGGELFKKFYDKPSIFKFEGSFIDRELFTPTKETLDVLRKDFGKFGIYSGRPKIQGMYILEKYNYTEYFDEKSSVFLGDLLKSEAEMKKLGKPDPTLFIKLTKKFLGKGTGVAYVGDGISDALLVENARSKGLENLTFLGVLSSSEDSNKLFIRYANHGADAIIKDVNDIPDLLTSLEGSV